MKQCWVERVNVFVSVVDIVKHNVNFLEGWYQDAEILTLAVI